MNIEKILVLPVAFACALCFSACEGDNIVSVKTEPAADSGNQSEKSDDPTNQGSTEKLLIDDFEDGDGISALGDPWYTGSDAGTGAESTIEPGAKDAGGQPKPTKTDNGSKNALSFKYTLKKSGYEWDPFVNWGVHLPAGKDYSNYTGITYRYKGGYHSIRIETSDVKDSDYHLKRMNSTKEWTLATVEFSELAQEGWGVSYKFDPSHITGISIQVKGPDDTDSLAIDDVYLITSP
jgi:licheninase